MGMLCDFDLAQNLDFEEEMFRRPAVARVPRPAAPLEAVPEEDETGGNRCRNAVTADNADDSAKSAIEQEKTPEIHFTGNGPFLALDILNDSPFIAPAHIYRYDLESLFYILVWFCALFDPKKHDYRPSPLLSVWEMSDMRQVAQAKTAIYSNPEHFDELFNDASPEYYKLQKDWAVPLWDLIEEVHVFTSKEKRELRGASQSTSARAAVVTRIQAQREEVLTYNAFMKAIGEDPL